jgi:hypothetical protein
MGFIPDGTCLWINRRLEFDEDDSVWEIIGVRHTAGDLALEVRP